MKTLKLLSVVVAAASTLFVSLSARAEYKCELSFSSAPSTALENFPVLVRLAEDAPTGFSYADCPTASCIWFTDENDDAIPCDVDTWDDEGESLVWVSVPSLSSSAKITMHWDASGAPAGLPASSQVWSLANYVGVWHMNEILEDTATGNHYTPDSSASGWHAYKANESDAVPAPVTTAPGASANPTPLTGTAMNIAYGAGKNNTSLGGFLVPATQTASTTLNGPGFTLSAIVNSQQIGNNGRGRVIGFGNNYNDLANLTVGSDKIYCMGPSSYMEWGHPKGSTDWVFATDVFNTQSQIYSDGVNKANGNPNLSSLTLAKGIGLGCFTDGKQCLDGYLDEARIRNVASTGEWIAEEYKTVTTANYVTFGDVDTGVEVLRLGAVAVSDVTPTNAVVTGELRTLGENATSADVWLVYTDGTTTNAVSLGSKSAEPSALSVTLENLTEKTTYTCWFTATNNLSAGADSKTATFRTKYIPTGSGIFECELSFPSAPATPLENFPVLVRLANDAPEGFLYEDCPTAAHLWFTDGYDTVLPFEADTWNTSGESLVWVSVPSFSSATKITMHWASDAGSVEDSPAASLVWTRAGYNAVWHFSGSNAESANGLVASVTKGSPTYDGNASYPGPLGKTLWLANNSALGYAVDPAWTTLGENASLTISCLARPVTASLGKYARMVCCQTSWDVKHGYTFAVHDPINKITLGSSDSSELALNSGTGGWTGWPASDWVHWAARYDNTAGAIFKDGQTAISGEIKTLITPQGVLYLGANGDGNQRFWVGGLDEIRIRAAASSDDWVAAEYATMATANYVSFGDVEEAAAGVSLEFGTPSVSSVSATGATLRVRLKSLGENATSANLWVVVSGFGQTRSYPLVPATGPKVVEATLSGLQPGVEWTAYLTATNNAAPAASTNSASVVFSTDSDAGGLGAAGLYQAVTASSAISADAAANWDIAASGIVTLGPLAMRCALSSGTHQWQATDGSSYQWSGNTGFGYAGCMYMEAGKDYYFGGAIDDAGYVWVDNGDANWDAKRGGSQLGGYQSWNKAGPYTVAKTGFRRVVFSCWNNGGGAGAESGGSVTSEQAALRYAAVANGAAAPGKDDASWLPAVDPGDGSLFRLSVDALREVSVLSAVRDGTLLSARVAVDAAAPGEMSKLRYVFGTTHGGNDPADWEGGSLVVSSLPATAATNDYIVGIAADTRYVRFYIDDDGAICWSATISLDWAGETTIADDFLFIGDPDVLSVGADKATVSAVLNAPGDGATAAQAWFVVTGGGETFTVPAGTATSRTNLTVEVTGLVPETEYSVWCTATNNAAEPVGADTPAATFTTGPKFSGWTPDQAAFKQDGKSFSATVPILNLGVGTTTLYLMTGPGNGNVPNISATMVVTETGAQTVTADFSAMPWGTKYYYGLMMVSGTAEEAVTNGPYTASGQIFSNKSFELQDNSTYTWVGGATGVWNDAGNWERTAAGSNATTLYAGYPVYGSTAVFATNVQVTVTIPATEGTTTVSGGVPSWSVSNVNLTNMDAPLVFTPGPQGQTSTFYIAGSIVATRTSNRITFDNCLCQLPNLKSMGASAYDAENGGNLVVTFTGGSRATFGSIEPSYPGVKVRIEDGSLVTSGHISSGSGNLSYPTVIEIEDAELRSTGRIEPDTNGKGGTIFRFLGRSPKLLSSYYQAKNADTPSAFEFVVPAGGYYTPPLHFYGDNILASWGNKAILLRVSADSPALAAGVGTTTRFVDAKIAAGSSTARVDFDLPTGVTTSTYTDANGNADGYVVAIPAGDGPALSDVALAYAGNSSFDVTGSVDPGSAGSAAVKVFVAEGEGDFAAAATTNVTAAGAFRLRVSGLTDGTAYRWYAEAVSASGRHATEPEAVTFQSGIASVSAATVEPHPVLNGDTVYTFTDSTAPGSITFSQGGLVEVLVVGGGGAGGNSAGGGGGGGAFLHRRAFVPAGTYAVTVGKGGYNATVANGVLPVAAESSSIGALFVAAGGGAGGCWDIPSGTSLGGSAGGNSDKVGTPTTSGTYPFGHDGGVVPVGGNKFFAAGGGGAGGVGGDGRIWDNVYIGGYGGDGVACDITGESVIYAAGGGGGAGSAGFISGAAGLGGVPGCGQADAIRVQDAPANTGAGGGGGNFGSNYLKQGGAGGSGIVVVRVLSGADDGTDALDVKTLTADVIGDSATISGSLIKLGAGATSANVWLVVTGGGETRSIDLGTTNAVPAAFTYKVEGLAYGTDYTFYLTATNNLGVGAGEASGAASAATPGNELYYSEISFPTAPATPLENFPVLLRISSASPVGFSYANCPTADKLWVLDDTGAVLPFEVDTWNPEGESLLWVSVPKFSADTTLTLQWTVDGHSRPAVPAATEVWSRANYIGVWHMNELLTDGTGTYTPDATANGWKAYKANEGDAFPLADTVSSYAASTPPTGRAMISQLGDDTFTTGGFLVPASLTSETTIGPFSISLFEAYVQPNNNKYSSLVSFASAFNTLASMRIKLDTCWIYNGGSNPSFSLTADGQAYSAWRHLGGVWDAVPYGYLNGEARYLNQKNWNVSKTLANGIGLGTLTGHTETQQGYLDEVRIRNAASSADWMAAEYATVMDHGYAVFEDAEIDTGAPRVGKPAIIEASGTGATLAATVVKLGDGATEADIWLVLEGGVETLTYPVGKATAPLQSFTNTVFGLEYSTVYTAYFTVTNNAAPAAGVNSKTVSFETETLPADWNTGSFTLSGSGKSLTASVNVTDLGTGTTRLYLMTGPGWNNENTISASRVITETGVQSFTLDYADVPWGTSVYVSFLLVNGTEQNAITNGPYTASGQAFFNKYVTFQDNSTYTWIGGAAGDWNDPTKWELTTKGSVAGETPAGYPVYGSTAYFKTNIAATVTIPATAGTSVSGGTPCWYVGSLNMSNMSAPLTFVSTSIADECRIQAGGISADNANLDVTFDGCYFNTGSAPHVGADTAVDGRNTVLTFKNGARGYFNQLWVDKPAAKVRVLSGSLLEDGYFLSGVNLTGEENRPVLEVEDAEYVNKANSFAFDWNNGVNTNGPLVRLLGTHPRVSSINFNMTRTAGGTTAIFEFVVPAGGYADAPVHFLSDSAFNSTLRSPITLRVSPDSPAIKAGFATTTRLVDAKIVDVAEEAAAVSFDLPSGVTALRHTNEDGNEEGYDCTIPAGDGPTLSNVGIVGCDDTSVRIGGTVDKPASIRVYVAVDGGEFVQAGSSGSSGGSFLIKARNLAPGVRYRWYVEAATASGSHRTEAQEFTFRPGKASVSEASVEPIWVGDEKVYVFTNSTEVGSITFAQGGLVEVLVIGGGGAGGNAMGGGGGAGAFLYRRDFIPAGTYAVTVGKGGYNTDNNQNNYAVPAEASSIGDVFVAPGGGAGAHWNSQGLTQGGSAGGNSGGAGIPAIGSYPLGRDGGSQTTGGQWIGSGGGGAGSAGHDARTWSGTYYGGRGGDGVACSITGVEKIYAAGGGGGAGTAGYIPGSAGLGGVRGCGMSDTERFDAPANTGSGGGGGNYIDNAYRMGGSGGSGIVVIRVKKFDRIGFSITVR